jgi:hypothetical protein
MKHSFTAILSAALLPGISLVAFAQKPGTDKPNSPLYNTARQKLLDGKQVFSFTQSKADPAPILFSCLSSTLASQ